MTTPHRQTEARSGRWTRQYFDTVYLRRWALGPPNDVIHRHVDFMAGELAAKPGQKLLDVGCGQGRYSLAFASRGLQVTGLDYSMVLLREARRLGTRMAVDVEWVRGDMRAIPGAGIYSHAILLDAFGFFDSDEENAEVVRQMASAVGRPGRVLLAVVNGPHLLSTFRAVDREQGSGRVVHVRRELDAVRRVLTEDIAVEEHGRRYEATRRQRLYSSGELADIAERSGLAVRGLWGDLGGAPFDEAGSGKVVLICERRADHAQHPAKPSGSAVP